MWYLIDTIEGGLYWVRASSLNEALSETGTWATGFSFMDVAVKEEEILSLPAGMSIEDVHILKKRHSQEVV